MRVLFINDYAAGEAGSGGCEVQMAHAMDLLRRIGVELELFTFGDIGAHRLTPWRYIDHRAARRALVRQLQSFRPNIIHLHNFYHVLSPGILAELKEYRARQHAQVIMTAHDYHLLCPNSGGMWFTRSNNQRGIVRLADLDRLHSLPYLLGRRWDRRSQAHSILKLAQHIWNYRIHKRRRVIDCVICPSRFIQKHMQSAGLNTSFLPHPAPSPKYDSPIHKPEGEMQILFAGRIEPEKGLAEFLEIIPTDEAWHFMIVGDGSEQPRCREICRRRGLDHRVEFAGRLPHDLTMSAMARAHLLVLPSLWWENYPLSLLEALAAQTNILVSHLGGMHEIVDTAGVGFTFTPGNAASLRAALERIIAAHQDRTLNTFTLSPEILRRNEQAYLDGLLQVYRGEHVMMSAAAPVLSGGV